MLLFARNYFKWTLCICAKMKLNTLRQVYLIFFFLNLLILLQTQLTGNFRAVIEMIQTILGGAFF